ncbi:glycoside hydrolase family 2 protein [Cohnella sp. GCM10012308]|uniref:glycoside hydrolase family 2 protein n=1 Tax=Cohnella sp. GCM10012308 TaxID=3317329 RepID=UPI003606E705
MTMTATGQKGSILSLNGTWELLVDRENKGIEERWFDCIRFEAQPAPVPGAIQQVFPGYHGVAWYWKTIDDDCARSAGERTILRFGAVDYLADVWVNGKRAGSFEGGETPFEFDVTDIWFAEGGNLLAVRVLNPTNEPIDGIVLGQVPHRNKNEVASAGGDFNHGGIKGHVDLRTVPAVYVADVFVQPDMNTGIVKITTTVRNSLSAATTADLNGSVARTNGSGDTIQAERVNVNAISGESVHEMTLTIPNPRLWRLEDPFLYQLTIEIHAAGQRPHRQSVRFGFRDFRIVDGFFHLNGKRIFLKSTHTMNATPVTMHVQTLSDHLRKDMFYLKAAGFNAVRFIAGVASPEQLDLCDEIGLLVFQETMANWCLNFTSDPKYPTLPYSEEVGKRYDHSNIEMIKRDRNHPCIAAWSLLNETYDGPVFERAVAFLPTLRRYDTSRLALLNSGRFDFRFSIGSASNPGGDEWEYCWGIEAPDAPTLKFDRPSADGCGEFHFYPPTPQSAETNSFLRQLGNGTKPVYLSEYGIGSLFNVINEWRRFEQAQARTDLEDASWLQEQSESLYADWKRLGLDDAYPFPEDMLRDSQRLNARQRTFGFDLIRSNPSLCGYNLTGMLDHGMCGEGMWTLWREWKPAMFDAVSDGFAPLRWCLFVDAMHGYCGREITVEAVLATEDALAPGEYPARFKVFGPTGTVWEKVVTFTIPKSMPFAVPVIKETIKIDGLQGSYTFAANLERGGAPSGGTVKFQMTDPKAYPLSNGQVTLWGIDEAVEKWLIDRGLNCVPLQAGESPNQEVIIVGNPVDASNEETWMLLKQRMKNGAAVLFADPMLFIDNESAIQWLPLTNKGTCKSIKESIYHKECVANRHVVFDGLQGPGILDMDYYGQVISHEIFLGQDTPYETICAGFNTGHYRIPRGYESSLLIAHYQTEEGRFFLNALNVLAHIDRHPAADRLLLNLIRYSQTTLGREM